MPGKGAPQRDTEAQGASASNERNDTDSSHVEATPAFDDSADHEADEAAFIPGGPVGPAAAGARKAAGNESSPKRGPGSRSAFAGRLERVKSKVRASARGPQRSVSSPSPPPSKWDAALLYATLHRSPTSAGHLTGEFGEALLVQGDGVSGEEHGGEAGLVLTERHGVLYAGSQVLGYDLSSLLRGGVFTMRPPYAVPKEKGGGGGGGRAVGAAVGLVLGVALVTGLGCAGAASFGRDDHDNVDTPDNGVADADADAAAELEALAANITAAYEYLLGLTGFFFAYLVFDGLARYRRIKGAELGLLTGALTKLLFCTGAWLDETAAASSGEESTPTASEGAATRRWCSRPP